MANPGATINVDVVIIGSGAGGSAVAQRMAPLVQKGKRVLVLEKGPKFVPSRHTGRELEMAGSVYNSSGGFMVEDRTVSLAFAEGYGGSSTVYTGTSFVPPQRIIESWALPGLSYERLKARAESFLQANNVHFTPEAETNDNNKLFKKGCEALGWHAERFPVSTKGCKGSSLCNLTCPNSAKQGAATVQLPAAQAAGIEVITGADVRRIDGNRLTVQVKKSHTPLADSGSWDPGNYTVTANTIVVAGNAVASPALLLRSGLGSELPALGRYFTCQPAQILAAMHDHEISNIVGHPKSYLYEGKLVEEHYFLETCMYFPFVTAKNMTGFGRDHAEFMDNYRKLQQILVLACDEALPEHRITVDEDGNPHVHYTLTPRTIEALVQGNRAAAKIFFAAGAAKVHSPASRPTTLTRQQANRIDELVSPQHFLPGAISVSAAHLMGGCRMGTNRATSVTTTTGQVHGRPGLFVADSSLFPTALEINPYVTVCALADHVADAVLDREGV